MRWPRLLASGPPEHSVPLRFWTLAAVVVSVFAVTAHDEFLGYQVSIPPLVAAGFAFSYWRRGRRNWWVKIVLAALCLVVGSQFLRDVLADPYHTSIPLTVLLLWLQTLHAFDVPARRDLLFSLLSSAILMAVAGAFTTSLTYLLYLAAYTVAAVHALAYNAAQATQAIAHTPVADPEPARRAAASLTMAANHLLVLIVVCAAAVFVLTPRFEGMLVTSLPFSPQRMLLDLFAGRVINPAYPDGGDDAEGRQPLWNPRGYFGFSPTVDLRLRGRLDERIVMRVRASRQFNWRALGFDTYTGSGWRIADQRTFDVDANVPPIAVVHRQDEVLSYSARTLRVTQTFYIEAEQPNVVFAAPMVERLYITAGRVYLDRYGAIRLPGTLRPGMVYSVVSRALLPDAGRLRAATGEIPRFIRTRYTRLPALPERVEALARRLVAGQPTMYDQVVAVNRYLWTAHRYDLTIPPQRRPGDAVDYFLFEERRGYCEQFASAMAVLLRAAGIPARLVTGYAPGTLNPVTGLLEVKNSDAHAWVEVFFPGVGWVDFEPTPGFPDTADLGGPAVRRWVFQDLAVRLRGWLRVTESRWAVARLVIAAAQMAADVAVALALPVALVLGGLIAAAGTRKIAADRARPRVPRTVLADIYDEMCAALARRGLRRGRAETPAEFARRAGGGYPEVTAISTIVEAAAYGGLEPEPGTAAHARQHLRRLRVRLRRRRGRSD